MLHEHHLIICVGAGLIQFVSGSLSRMAADLILDKNLFPLPFSRTGTTLNMQPAVETAKKMTGILMCAETIDQHGKSCILVVPVVTMYDPGM